VSLSPRARCVALAVAALFASPASLYARWLPGGPELLHDITSLPGALAVALLVATVRFSRASNSKMR
jgi:hypothetical protein